jgi:hypothetical protein
MNEENGRRSHGEMEVEDYEREESEDWIENERPEVEQDWAESDGGAVALLDPEQVTDLNTRWDSIQIGFVDEPRRSVQEADALVEETMDRITQWFAGQRRALDQQWSNNEDVSTEDLRRSLRGYRSFFHRLLDL